MNRDENEDLRRMMKAWYMEDEKNASSHRSISAFVLGTANLWPEQTQMERQTGPPSYVGLNGQILGYDKHGVVHSGGWWWG